MFLLRPDDFTTNAVGYIVGVAAERYGIELHAVVVMSNHWHFVITDPDGRICEFTKCCHQFIACVIHSHFGDEGEFWERKQTNHVSCETPESMLEKIAYVMANPVESALVMYGFLWPGLRGCWGESAPARYTRPWGFFSKNIDENDWPPEIELKFARPPGYENLSDEELAAAISTVNQTTEEAARQKVISEGRTFLGRRGVLAQPRHATPASVDIEGIESEDGALLGFRRKKNRGRMRPRRRWRSSTGQNSGRGKIVPRVACKDKWRRIECLQRDRVWLEAYRCALERWRNGDREVVFPYGTYKLRILAGVNVAPP